MSDTDFVEARELAPAAGAPGAKESDVDEPKLGLIGHDYAVIRKLARQIWHDLPHGTMVTPLRDTADHRGLAFEVQTLDDKKKPTGHIARVQVTLGRIDAEAAGDRG